jgi:hypothetical protein
MAGVNAGVQKVFGHGVAGDEPVGAMGEEKVVPVFTDGLDLYMESDSLSGFWAGCWEHVANRLNWVDLG